MNRSLDERLSFAYFRLESRRESGAPLRFRERVSLDLIRRYQRVTDWARWITAFRFGSLGRAFHQISGNEVDGPPLALDEAVHAQADLLANMPASWRLPPPQPRPSSPDALELAPPELPAASLRDALAARSSIRRYAERALRFDEVSTFLGAAFGTRPNHGRTYPSGGAQFPTEIYYVPLRGTDRLAPGAYRYASAHHMLEPVASGSVADLLMPDATVETAPAALLLFVSDLRFIEKKYGEFGYRLALLEAGHMGQNAYLVATAMNLATVALGVGNFNLWQVNRRLEIDGVDRTVVHAMVLGARESSS